MKVVFYSGVFARNGGIEMFTRDLALALHASGIEVQIVCASMGNPVLSGLTAVGIDVFRVPVFHGCRWGVPDYALLPLALPQLRKADIVIHQKPLRSGFYRLLSRKPRHVYITAYRPREQFPDLLQRRRFFSFFDLVLTQGQVFKQDLIDVDIDRPIEVAPLILGDMPYQPPRNGEDGILRIGIMGRLEPQKNLSHALELVAYLKRRPPAGWRDVQLNIYGSGSLEGEVSARAAKLGLPVEFHGAYAHSKVPEIVADNDVFLVTSVSEGQCIVALEILAGGRPLFATPVGALPDILARAERGALLPMEDAADGADRIREWLERNAPVSAEKIRQGFLQEYNPQQTRRRYLELFKGMVSEK